MKKVIISVVVIVLALVGIAYVLQQNKARSESITKIVAEENNSVAVKVDTADDLSIHMGYQVNGIFAPKQEVKISAETAGRVTRVLVDEGDHVASGQVLARIESDRQDVTVSNAEAVYQNAESELKRYQSAYSTGGVTQQQLEQVKLKLENAKSSLENAKIAAGDVNIRASFAGVINQRSVEPGTYVSPGQVLFDIVNVPSLNLRVNVDEKNITGVQIGQRVKVGASVLPGRSWTAAVTFIAPKANDNLSFPVELEIKNADHALRAGMYGTAYFGSNDSLRTLVIPRAAFVGSVSSHEVFLVKGGKAVLTTVMPGRIAGDNIEVISGLKQGDVVVTSGQVNLVDGSPIQIIN